MLKFYIISTVLVLMVICVSAVSMTVELKREGLRPKTKSTPIERIRAYLPYLVPFINILLALIFIFAYDTIKDDLRVKWLDKQA